VAHSKQLQEIGHYYDRLGSRLGYRWLLRGRRHYGYYPFDRRLSTAAAQRLMEREVGHALGLTAGSLVLDAGCGEGCVGMQVARDFGYRVRGVDLHAPSIARARRSASGQRSVDVRFTRGDYSHLPFSRATFDGVYTMETLVHAPDYHAALAELHRVLIPGGRIALFEYSIDPANVRTRAQDRLWRLIAQGSAMHSLMSFEHGRFPQILADAGFADVAVRDVTQATMPMLQRLHRLAWLPYQAVRRLGREGQYVNITAAAGVYDDIRDTRAWRYNIVTATKPRT
jgi:sterol 24-C-methyltransferase